MRAVPILVASLLLTACLPFVHTGGVRVDAFDRPSLDRYTPYSDDGEAWRIGGGRLWGDGRAIQSVLIVNGEAMDDGWVETETGHADDGGLILGFQDNENHYLLAIRDDDAPEPRGRENLKLYRRVKGRYETLWQADLAWPRGARRKVRMEARDGRILVHLDGRLLASERVRSVSGGFGLRHDGATREWRTRYDVFRWRGSAPSSR